jgi:VWFA-related protein
VTVFQEHKATDVEEGAKAPVLPPHVYGNFPQYRVASAANVLLLDALNTPQNDQGYAREKMLEYLHTIPAGTQIAVFTLASRLRMVSGFTTDAGAIEQALSLENTKKQKSMVIDPAGDVAEREVESTEKADQFEMMLGVDQWENDRQTYQEEARVDITLGALGQLARYLSGIPGRKNLIWISGGLAGALDPDWVPAGVASVEPDFQKTKLNQEDRIAPAARRVNAELARARVAMYPVDARGEMTPDNASLANVVAPTEMGMAADVRMAKAGGAENDIDIPAIRASSQQEMAQVAKDTGGEAFYNTNAVGKAVAEAIADGENYYTLGYAPQHATDDGAWHAIGVRVEDGKYELQYRRGYYALAAGREMPLLSAMSEAMEHGAPPLSQVIFQAQVLAAGDPELHGLEPTPGPAGKPPEPLQPPVTRYFVEYRIDPQQLALKALPDGRQQAEVEVTQAVYDSQGKRLNSTDAGLQATLTAEQMAQALKMGLRVRQEIDVPAGPVWLRLGVRDATSERIGTVELRLNEKG